MGIVSSTASILALLALGYLTIPLLNWLKDRVERKKMEITKREINILKAVLLFLVASLVAVLATTYGY